MKNFSKINRALVAEKKFFSILCAFAIVFSANAAKLSKKEVSLQKDAVKLAKHQPAKKQAQKSTVAFRDLTKKVQATAATKQLNTKALAPQAKLEEVPVTIAKVVEKFYAESSDVYFKLTDAAGDYSFAFDIFVAEGDSTIEIGKTYTLEDMDANYSYGIDYIKYDYVEYDSVTFVKTLTAEGLAKIDVTILAADSDTYVLTYEETEFVLTGDTITINFEESMLQPYFYSDGSVELGAENEDYEVTLTYFTHEEGDLTGEYTIEDFDLAYSYIFGTAKVELVDAILTATATETRIDVAATVVGEDGNVYEITMFFDAPVKEGEGTIEATNLTIDDSWFDWFGVLFLEASNDEVAISLTVSAEGTGAALAGEYVIGEDASGVIENENGEFDLYSGSFTVAYADGAYTVTGKVLAFDNIEYTLNLSYIKPEKTREETVTATGLELALYDGAWQISGYNADETRYISVAAYTDEVAGTYTEENIATNYTFVYYIEDGEAYEGFKAIEANLVVTFDEAANVATVKGTFLGQGIVDATDAPLFTLDLTASIDESGHLDYDNEDTPFKEVFESYEIEDKYLEEYGELIVTAQNENGAYAALEIVIAEGDSTLTPGEYTFSDSEEAGPMNVIIGSCDGQYVYYSFFGTLTEDGYIDEMWFPVDGKLTVLENGVIEVVAVNSYGVQIECRIGAWPEAIDNTEVNAAATKRIVKGQLIIEKNGVKYNVLGAEVK